MRTRNVITACLLTVLLLMGVLGGTAHATGVYLFSVHWSGVFEYWDLDPTTDLISYQATYTLSCQTDPAGVDIWEDIDANGIITNAYIFITGEFSGNIEIVDAISFTYVDCVSTGAGELAGIGMDRINNILYAVVREGNQMYAFDFDPVAVSLTARPGYPVALPGMVSAFGLALDYFDGVAYIADAGSGTVRGYDVGTWAQVFTWSPPAGPVGIAIDPYGQILYTTNPDGSCASGQPGGLDYICKYDIAAGVETYHDLGASHGCGSMGVAVNWNSGIIYVTGGCYGDEVTVWDTSTTPWTNLQTTADIGDPAGMVLSRVAPPTDPDVAMGSSVPDGECVDVGDDVTLSVEYLYDDIWGTGLPVTDVVIVATLDEWLDFVSSPTGAYDGPTHAVTWDIGTLNPGDSGTATVETEVNSSAVCEEAMRSFVELSYAEGDPVTDETGFPVCECIECVLATLGEPEYVCGSLRIPVELSGVEAQGDIWGVDVIVNYDPAIVEGSEVDFVGTVLEGFGWSYIFNPPMPGEFRVGLAGTTPVPASGVLVYIVFDVLDHSCGACTPLVLDILLNEGEPCVEVIPVDDWCAPPGVVDGEVKYWYCCDPPLPRIPGTEVCLFDGSGALIGCMDTDPTGAFAFEVCQDECYTLVPNRPCGETAGISTLDAALCLRYFVMLDPLNDCIISPMQMWDGTYCPPDCVYPQQIAADVTGNGSIHSYDGAIILRYIVGHDVSEYLVGCWTFYCHERYFCMDNPLCCDLPEQCFTGVLYGDVTGNWPEEPVEGPARQSEAIISVACVDCEPGSTVEVPVMLEGADGFYGLEFKILHDADLAGVVNVIPSDLALGGLLEWSATDGQVHVAAARPMGYEGDGEFCRIVYQAADEPSGDQCCLDLEDAYADEDPEPLEMVDGGIQLSLTGIPDGTTPQQYALYPAAPNPFNPMTKIAYDVPAGGGHVRIEIYDVTGRVVRTLVNTEKSGGHHEAVWHGRTDGGERAASGIYFCRMEAPSYVVTKKLTMLQ